VDEDQDHFTSMHEEISKELEPTVLGDMVAATVVYALAGIIILTKTSLTCSYFLKEVSDLLDRRS